MASDEALELLEEKCDSHRQNAQRYVESSPRQAVYHFSKAADLHDRLADEIDSDPVGTAHRSQAETMRSNAHRLMQKLDLVPDNRRSDEHRERKQESEAAMSTKDSEFFESPPDFDLSDVGGMYGLKQRLLSEVRRPLENPEFYEKQGAGIENGVLLHGPPGTGKTHVAKCFAGELGSRLRRSMRTTSSPSGLVRHHRTSKNCFRRDGAVSPACCSSTRSMH